MSRTNGGHVGNETVQENQRCNDSKIQEKILEKFRGHNRQRDHKTPSAVWEVLVNARYGSPNNPLSVMVLMMRELVH
jgi:hypothetical protein